MAVRRGRQDETGVIGDERPVTSRAADDILFRPFQSESSNDEYQSGNLDQVRFPSGMVIGSAIPAYQIDRKCGFRRAHGPNIKVVHFVYTGRVER